MMKLAMMWFDNDPNATLETKVERAAAYFRNKYKAEPTLVFINPKSMPAQEIDGAPVTVGTVAVKAHQFIMPNHFWIGVTEG